MTVLLRAAAVLFSLVLAVSGAGIAGAAGDPSALWRIVGDECVPNEIAHGDPAPCAEVEPDYAVLKDLVGPTQFLLIPTRRLSGIDDPAILAPGVPNYFAAAWRARSFVDERAGATLPREWLSLAINSAFARSQDQLHIHVDCLSPGVHEALTEHAAAIGPSWAPFPVPLAGHRYDAMSVIGDELVADPFALLADGVPGARDDMAARTLVVVGSNDVGGGPGFVVLTDRADPATGDQAAGEELQDHDFCPRLAAVSPGK
ncbi:CDP-diacylglycerol diphosphatase [Mycolicibacterium sp.]|uniref:CDP-diacylglycerol diphosphatase n=1 Tax=Mycolicibacterium sp. TaxID=2320850 RepID=UPI001A216CD0|nr:CDP-diacylglycerol diphosphatase [Mycolicibacterium sp.]MBJ7336909.1 CDP-diacylglycerol diphosphatase [Mycolicibacterium sp.]